MVFFFCSSPDVFKRLQFKRLWEFFSHVSASGLNAIRLLRETSGTPDSEVHHGKTLHLLPQCPYPPRMDEKPRPHAGSSPRRNARNVPTWEKASKVLLQLKPTSYLTAGENYISNTVCMEIYPADLHKHIPCQIEGSRWGLPSKRTFVATYDFCPSFLPDQLPLSVTIQCIPNTK